jgi:hyaluronoglucosaminidase
MNLYVYSPKDDAYLRHDWRVPYPAPRLGVLGKLAQRAAANHVTFTYTLSPGLSVCYSSAADRDALVAKFQSLWNVGVSSFAVALDDIDYAKWNCAADAQAFGTGPAAAAAAQASLLDAIQNRFVETHRGAGRLVLVPTEYDGTASTPYRETLARQLDRKIAVMWTGNSVCAPSIHTDDARAARASYGHDVLVWDNFPVTCRQRPLWLELGPYEHRDPDLPTAIVGIASNPMSQPYGSRIALFTVGDYAWNTRAYDPRRSWFGSTADLAGGDPAATAALRVFADVNYASTVEPHQAPILSARIAAFWRAWRARDAHAADPLRAALDKLTTAPAVLRARLRDARFLADTAPWLDATQAWGHAALEALAALEARRSGLAAEARAHELSARSFAARAGSFSSFGEGGTAPVAVGAGVLDAFVGAALAAPG